MNRRLFLKKTTFAGLTAAFTTMTWEVNPDWPKATHYFYPEPLPGLEDALRKDNIRLVGEVSRILAKRNPWLDLLTAKKFTPPR